MERRNDIDGLRAVAVLGVVLHHAGLAALPGGFVGVDVFFVISGFLISRIITDGVADGSFSLAHFYERRARRILPALIPVVALSLIAGYWLLLPDDYENLGQSAVATLVFANNVLLTLTSGYWDLAATFKPLLHTWSLGVEEQFYIAYPLLALLVLRRRPRLFAPMLAGAITISLLLSVGLSARQPDASFYLIHTRAWELLLGALTAWRLPRTPRPERVARMLALAGLAMIIGAMVLIDERAPYPGWRALLPCVGTALILRYGTASGLAQRVLGWGPLVLIGLASYSIYLWHQPLFAFARALSVTPPGAGVMAALTLATLVIGTASWRWIEQPFRDARVWPLRPFLTLGIGAVALAGAAALTVSITSGVPQRVPGMGLGTGDYAAYNNSAFRFQKDRFDDPARPNLLVVGNSMARDMVNMLVESRRFDRYEIVYRTDANLCGLSRAPATTGQLIADARAVIFVASMSAPLGCKTTAAERDAILANKAWLLIGPKHFGYNLNAWMHVPASQRPAFRAVLLPKTVSDNAIYAALVPPDHYVDLLGIMQRRHGGLPVFDAQGRILSADRIHLTRAGAQFFAGSVLDDPAWRPLLALAPR
ncbi:MULTISPECIES: acyltransferase family protein [unclassified Sphingomonas]|uniref:acyltransferase family protein n=1 Tax=unclassified Sphingomonas TaxID=196159 RepID=UPI0008295623|nr:MULTISPECIES: acyltransferase [unclassified Sphingomonas]